MPSVVMLIVIFFTISISMLIVVMVILVMLNAVLGITINKMWHLAKDTHIVTLSMTIKM
jgi:hypothetical protein